MTKSDGGAAFHWYASSDSEHYTVGPCDTRDQVIDEATDMELGWQEDDDGARMVFHVIEASKPVFNLADHFDAAHWFEMLENGPAFDLGDPDGDGILSIISKAAGDDLEARVREVIRKWQADHKLDFDVWAFGATRNGEWVTVPVQMDADATTQEPTHD